MQKPDDSNDPHPLYQPMKPDVPDYKPVPVEEQLGSTKHSKYEAESAAGNKVDSSYTPIPNQNSKQNWFGRLSRRTKIIAGVVILIVIFLAAFIPAYLTTHSNNSANNTNTTDPNNTTTVPPPGRKNLTDAGLPINNATYRISIAGGRAGCNQYLSVIDCAGGGLVDMYSGDDSKHFLTVVHTIHIYS
jgi:hypothetical protein